MIRYGQEIKWTDFNGSKSSILIQDCDTLEEARAIALRSAKNMGWTPPRWWQWWRWRDTALDTEDHTKP